MFKNASIYRLPGRPYDYEDITVNPDRMDIKAGNAVIHVIDTLCVPAAAWAGAVQQQEASSSLSHCWQQWGDVSGLQLFCQSASFAAGLPVLLCSLAGFGAWQRVVLLVGVPSVGGWHAQGPLGQSVHAH